MRSEDREREQLRLEGREQATHFSSRICNAVCPS